MPSSPTFMTPKQAIQAYSQFGMPVVRTVTSVPIGYAPTGDGVQVTGVQAVPPFYRPGPGPIVPPFYQLMPAGQADMTITPEEAAGGQQVPGQPPKQTQPQVSSAAPYIQLAGQTLQVGAQTIAAIINGNNATEQERLRQEAAVRIAQIRTQAANATSDAAQTAAAQQIAALQTMIAAMNQNQNQGGLGGISTPMLIAGGVALALVGVFVVSRRR